MRVAITGLVVSFRYVDVKTGSKVGQIDILQAGNEVDPAKVIQVFIPSREFCNLILQHMQGNQQPYITLLAWLEYQKDLHIHIKEILSISVEQIGAVSND